MKSIFKNRKLSAFAAAVALTVVFAPLLVRADSFGDKKTFNIDKTYDAAGRSSAAADLVWVGSKLYFYADDGWWTGLDAVSKTRYSNYFQNLDTEFAKNIYPKLTALYGSEVNPTVNRDGMVTVFVDSMVKDAGGYINTADGYSKYQAPVSNEREMIYLNTRFIDSPLAKSYLAHEFTHLIAFNQKDRLRGVTDDVWLNEARADYSSTVLGYDSPFSGSNFGQRVMSFSADSGKSLVDWADKPANYGAAHLFMQYLVDQYGIKILADSMDSNAIGIASIDYALQKNGFNVDFDQVYQNWTIALLANNCRLGGQYCYKSADLDGFGVAPRINYLPNSDQVSLSVMYDTDYFSGNWQKIVGGNGDLSLDFSSDAKAKFVVPYLLCYVGGSECKVGELTIDSNGAASLKLPDFGRQYSSLTLMPFASGKTTGFGNFAGNALSYSFKIAVSPKAADNSSQNNAVVTVDPKIQALMDQIAALKQQIAQLQALLAARISSAPAPAAPTSMSAPAGGYSCKSITADLYFGVENYKQVVCLQQLLKAQGASIYPEGQVTGSYSLATQAAVARFQEKYAAEILIPLGLKKGTGYVSQATRNKINQLLAGK